MPPALRQWHLPAGRLHSPKRSSIQPTKVAPPAFSKQPLVWSRSLSQKPDTTCHHQVCQSHEQRVKPIIARGGNWALGRNPAAIPPISSNASIFFQQPVLPSNTRCSIALVSSVYLDGHSSGLVLSFLLFSPPQTSLVQSHERPVQYLCPELLVPCYIRMIFSYHAVIVYCSIIMSF